MIGKRTTVHSNRLLPYKAALNGKEVPDGLKYQVEHLESKFEIVEELVDISKGDNGIFFHVRWPRLPDRCDWTWQPLQELFEDIADRLLQFLRSGRKRRKLKDEAMSLLGVSNSNA